MSKTDELVSIIMPAYNAEKYIADSINSVKDQTYRNWELIVINDCSSDKTVEIVEELASKDERIHLINNKKNFGVALSRNRGIREATGKYIAFLDSDDLWISDKLEKQIAFMDYQGINFSFTNYQKFDSETGKRTKVMRGPDVMSADDVLGDTSIGCLTVVINQQAVGKFYMPDMKHMEDNATWYEILKKGNKAYRIDEILALYREGNQSLTANKFDSAVQQWNVYRHYFAFGRIRSIMLFASYAVKAVKKHYF